MPFAALLIGAVLIVTALNNTHLALAQQLEKDVPGFFTWAIAIALVLALGYVPALKTPSRWLLALIVVVLVVSNYKTLFANIQAFAKQGSAPPSGGGPAATGPSGSTPLRGAIDPTQTPATDPFGNVLQSVLDPVDAAVGAFVGG